MNENTKSVGSVFKGLLGDGLIYGLGSSLNGLATFVLIPFITRHLVAAEYGRFAIAEMLINLLLTFEGLGLGITVLSRYSTTEPNARREFLGKVFLLVLIASAVCDAALLLVLGLLGPRLLPSVSPRMAILVCITCAAENVWMAFGSFFRAEGRALHYVVASIIQAGVELLAIIFLVPRSVHKDQAILTGRIIGDLALLIFVTPQMIKYRPRLELMGTLELLRFGAPLVPAALSSTWVAMFPRFFLDHLGTSRDVGIFAMSSKIAAIMSMGFVQPFALAWMTAIFQIYLRSDARQIYSKVVTYYLLSGFTLALCIGLIAPQIGDFLGRRSFPLPPTVMLIMACSAVAAGLFNPLNIGPYVKRQTSAVLPVCVASVALSLLFGWSLVKLWGVTGAALASLFIYFVQAILIGGASQSLYRIEIEWARIVKVFCALIVGFCVARSVPVANSAVAIVALPAIFLLCVGSVLLMLRFMTSEEWNSATRLTRNFRKYASQIG